MRVPYAKGLQLYTKSPLWMQNFLGFLTKPIPRSSLYGSGFNSFFQMLSKTQWYKPEPLKKIQENNLRSLIKHAYQNVPYYHKVFKKRKLRPDDIKTIEDLRKLPILSKDDVRKNFTQLVAVNSKNFNYGFNTTHGTTGKPLTFCLDQQNREKEYATQWRQLQWAGIDFSAKIATFRGNFVYTHGKTKAISKFNALSKELDFNSYNMNENLLLHYIKKLKNFQPDLIKGYPSVLQTMSKFMLNNNIKYSPKVIQTSSETLFQNDREFIEKAFECKIYDWYGQSEYVVSAGQCPEGNYHINVESGIMEFIKDDENVSPDELGEILGTGFFNYSMPFIRYKIGDVGRYSSDLCACGRALPLLQSLEGRINDLIITPDNKTISGLAFHHYWRRRINPYLPNVEDVHIIQKSKRKLLIELVKKEGYLDKETHIILKELKMLLGSQMEIEFKDVDPMQIGNKRRFTESELNANLG